MSQITLVTTERASLILKKCAKMSLNTKLLLSFNCCFFITEEINENKHETLFDDGTKI